MLLLHRLTPFAIGIAMTTTLVATSFYPLIAPWALPLLLLGVFFLMARLADFRYREKDFWGLIATPVTFSLASCLLFVLADNGSVRLAIAFACGFLISFYEEHLFRFVHLPAAYQAYGLQNTSGVMSILTMFYFAAAGYAVLSFIRVPLVILSVAMFVIWLLVSLSAFWMAKVPRDRASLYALAGAVLFTELFVAASYLPTPFMTNGAFLAVLFYIFIGLSRANVLSKLSRVVIRRYVGVGTIMLMALLITAKWM